MKDKMQFNVTIRYDQEGEFEGRVSIDTEVGDIIIIPSDPSCRQLVCIRNYFIDVCEESGIDTITFDVTNMPFANVTFRFPNMRRKSAFIELIRVWSTSSSSEDSMVSNEFT